MKFESDRSSQKTVSRTLYVRSVFAFLFQFEYEVILQKGVSHKNKGVEVSVPVNCFRIVLNNWLVDAMRIPQKKIYLWSAKSLILVLDSS